MLGLLLAAEMLLQIHDELIFEVERDALDDVAALAVFLASDAAGYITGHTLDVNGGMYMP